MSPSDWLPIATGVLVPVVLGFLTWIGGQQAAKRQTEASPYSALAERVTVLEKQVDELHRDRIEDRNLIRAIFDWFTSSNPQPTPPFQRPAWMEDSTRGNPHK